MKKLLSIFALVLFTASCTRLDFGLQFFSVYVKSQVDDMFELSSPQKELFSKKFSAQLEKVKQTQFPIYADYLEKIVDTYEKNLMTASTASQLFDEGSHMFFQTPPLWRSTIEDVVMTFKPDQFKSFEDYFYEKIDKQKKKYDSDKNRHKHQVKSMEKWVDETVESLTRGQEEKLVQYVKSNPKPYELSIKSQEHVFMKFKEAFPDVTKRKVFIQKFLTDWKSLQLPEYVKAHELYLEKLKDYVMDLSLNLNEKQKKNLIENLNYRVKELRKLSQASKT